eukprot:gnl/MRDRNA2_/MRDRNA2_26026_c0_seq1.p1 gnl/MRDRNA2_/MRDRNA2_26026_c0~~gnl/MRDRNA2_/MRDRNA2_26026_c0_seq1.p1  ORF type:complete len:116 (+),score=26.80 gnl/MRDRNA2_/MRDRNA2_26026_c0_seq1:97-444(+)
MSQPVLVQKDVLAATAAAVVFTAIILNASPEEAAKVAAKAIRNVKNFELPSSTMCWWVDMGVCTPPRTSTQPDLEPSPADAHDSRHISSSKIVEEFQHLPVLPDVQSLHPSPAII